MLTAAEPLAIYASASENSMEDMSEQGEIEKNLTEIEKNPEKSEETGEIEKKKNESINVKYIFNSAFQDCTRFSGELVIPANVEIIGNVERIESNAFSECNNITEIEVKKIMVVLNYLPLGLFHKKRTYI